MGKVCGPVGSGVDEVVVLGVELQAQRMLNKTIIQEPVKRARRYFFHNSRIRKNLKFVNF